MKPILVNHSESRKEVHHDYGLFASAVMLLTESEPLENASK
jgi:hypothetical protein